MDAVAPHRRLPAARVAERGGRLAPMAPAVLASASQVPIAVVDELLAEMAEALSDTAAALRCEGLSVTIVMSDHPAAPARYDVLEDGRVLLTRDLSGAPTFRVTASAAVIDAVLRGQLGVLSALASGRVHVTGPMRRLRCLLRMFPTVQVAYRITRAEVVARHAARYVFTF